MKKAITVYTTPRCSQCTMTKKWLDDPERGNMEGQYEVVDLSQDPQAYEAVKALGYSSAPVVIVNTTGDTKDETHWYGFRPDMLSEFARNAQPVAA
jgi:glutaredoxin-like protein NrdH